MSRETISTRVRRAIESHCVATAGSVDGADIVVTGRLWTKLSAEDQTLLEAFHSGVLLATKLEANQAWGFGEGAETKSIEQLAFLDHQIKAYFWAEAEEKKRKAVEAAEHQEAKRRRAVVEMARKRAGDRPDRAASKKQDADDESLSLESL